MYNKNEQERRALNRKLLNGTFKSERKKPVFNEEVRRKNLLKKLLQIFFGTTAFIAADLISGRWFDGKFGASIVCMIVILCILVPIESVIEGKIK